jgi:hypothetical protein
MDKKKPKKTRGATAKKTTVKAKSKKTPAKKKQVARGKPKTEKKITAKKTAPKEIKKIEVKATKGKTAGEPIKKGKEKVKIKKEGKTQKEKVAKKAEKKVIHPFRKKVEVKKVTAKPQKKTTAKRVVLPKKASQERPREVFFPEKEERYPPLPIEILSDEYGEDSIALMIVDPRKLFIYWEVAEDTFKKYKGNLNIRLYDITGVDFGGVLKNYVDIATHDKIGNLYLDVSPEKEFIADIGIIDSAGAFFMVARSNRASTPRAEVIEKEMLPHRLYETGIETSLLIPPVGYEK